MSMTVEAQELRMGVQEFGRRFYEDGYVCLDDRVSPELLAEARTVVTEALSRLLKRPVTIAEGIVAANEQHRQFDVQHCLHQELLARGFKRKLLLGEDILAQLIYLIGPDLAYSRAGSIVFNVHRVTDSLYQKKWHQEVWSGAGVNEVCMWLPLMMEPNTGGLEFIPGSHIWGLIPNQNREPKELPEPYRVVAPDLKEGTVVFFHSLTLHRTVPNPSQTPRIGLTVAVRNIFYPWTGQGYLQGWQPFHFSAMTRIQKALGNPFLTPFRTLGGSLDHRDPDDGKHEIDQILE